jgi:ATP-dependent DNA ligase
MLGHEENFKELDDGSFVLQLKLDDTRNLIIIKPGLEIEMWNRHQERHKAYSKPHPKLIESIKNLGLDETKYHVFDSLLLHNKNALVKDTVVLIDILVHNSEYLIQTTFKERDELLEKICGHPKRLEQHSGLELGLEVTPLLWKAKSYTTNFQEIFDKFRKVFEGGQKIVEGVVLKRLNGRLDYHLNTDKCKWQIKMRYSKKNYDF